MRKVCRQRGKREQPYLHRCGCSRFNMQWNEEGSSCILIRRKNVPKNLYGCPKQGRKENKMNEFFTWSFLGSFAGCTAATAIITQFIKNLNPIKRIPTQWISYFLSLILLYLATYFTVGLTGMEAAIIPFNAILIALSANGAFSAVARVGASGKKTKDTQHGS